MNAQDMVWDHFKFNAEQRLRGFNLFIALAIFADGGVFAALEKGLSPWLLIFMGGLILVFSVVFWLIDARSRQLLDITIPALKEIELSFPQSHRLFVNAASKQHTLIRFTFAIRTLLITQMLLGIGVILFGVYNLLDGRQEPTTHTHVGVRTATESAPVSTPN